MPSKHPNTERHGGPGASHENRQAPQKSRGAKPPSPSERKLGRSGISGGGGERDVHHTRDPRTKS